MGKTIRQFLRRHEIRLDRWYLAHGSWWMVQACFDGWFSLGIHIDGKRRINAGNGRRFGPYVDLHLGCVILSLGVNPVWTSEVERPKSFSRGGIPEGEAPWQR